jgi:DnaJ-class molecular chaperone
VIDENEKIKYLNELGLRGDKSYTPEDLKKTFHKLAKKHHPDKGGNEDDFRRINFAYKMLTDPSFQFNNLSKNKASNLNFMYNMSISFEQAFFGDTLTFTTNPVHVNENREPIAINKKEDIFLDVDVIKMRIPAGTQHGESLTIRKKGLIFKDQQGDLVVMFNVAKHPRFQMRYGDVVSLEHVPLDLMIKGGEFSVNTMYGIKTLDIPPGTMPNTELKISNCGVLEAGNHICLIVPLYPSKKELKKNKNWKKLGIKWPKNEEVEDECYM